MIDISIGDDETDNERKQEAQKFLRFQTKIDSEPEHQKLESSRSSNSDSKKINTRTSGTCLTAKKAFTKSAPSLKKFSTWLIFIKF